MATATAEKPSNLPADTLRPVTLEEWERERQQRRKDHDKKRKVLERCLDPEVAARYESRKKTYDFEVQFSLHRSKSQGGPIDETRTVNAQNERDAWAKFCDEIRQWPSPHSGTRKITKLQPRSLDDE